MSFGIPRQGGEGGDTMANYFRSIDGFLSIPILETSEYSAFLTLSIPPLSLLSQVNTP